MVRLFLFICILLISCTGNINKTNVRSNTSRINSHQSLEPSIRKEKLTESQARIVRLKKQYPFVFIGDDDYGILSEVDLWYYANHDHFDSFSLLSPDKNFYQESNMRLYWQCFPAGQVEIEFAERHDITHNENIIDSLAEITITASRFIEGIEEQHTYTLNIVSDPKDMMKTFKDWEKILEHKPYVCLGGEGHGVQIGALKKQAIKDSNHKYFLWILRDIKTCDDGIKKSCYAEQQYYQLKQKLYNKYHKQVLIVKDKNTLIKQEL